MLKGMKSALQFMEQLFHLFSDPLCGGSVNANGVVHLAALIRSRRTIAITSARRPRGPPSVEIRDSASSTSPSRSAPAEWNCPYAQEVASDADSLAKSDHDIPLGLRILNASDLLRRQLPTIGISPSIPHCVEKYVV